MNIKLLLFDINPDVCEQFEIQFGQFSQINIFNGYLEQLENYDCLVSPANSFGMMDGGIDEAIRNLFGKRLEEKVQNIIINDYFGEQPIGTSFIIETEHHKHPFLAHTPTMNIPKDINGTLNVYYAMKAMLQAVYKHNKKRDEKINTIACPGMGTLIGRMEPYIAVGQMALAYEHFLNPPKKINVPYIYERVSEINLTKNDY